MTKHEAEALRRDLRRRGGGRGERFDPELRRRIIAYAEERRHEGASWKTIATELGACFETVRRWCEGGTLVAARQLRRVEVVAEPAGVGIDDVVALVRALG